MNWRIAFVITAAIVYAWHKRLSIFIFGDTTSRMESEHKCVILDQMSTVFALNMIKWLLLLFHLLFMESFFLYGWQCKCERTQHRRCHS